ncbi:MAG: hypothetical protein H0U75_04575 [Legionella sp.]|nr:hypothetical protein [Legionella sp.]
MPSPELYYLPNQSQTKHRHKPTGLFDINRVALRKAPWIVSTSRVKKQRTLILADWTAFTWSQYTLVQRFSDSVLLH